MEPDIYHLILSVVSAVIGWFGHRFKPKGR